LSRIDGAQSYAGESLLNPASADQAVNFMPQGLPDGFAGVFRVPQDEDDRNIQTSPAAATKSRKDMHPQNEMSKTGPNFFNSSFNQSYNYITAVPEAQFAPPGNRSDAVPHTQQDRRGNTTTLQPVDRHSLNT
jgi:hypothetical protein